MTQAALDDILTALNKLTEAVERVACAIETPHEDWAPIPVALVDEDGDYVSEKGRLHVQQH